MACQTPKIVSVGDFFQSSSLEWGRLFDRGRSLSPIAHDLPQAYLRARGGPHSTRPHPHGVKIQSEPCPHRALTFMEGPKKIMVGPTGL